MTPLQRFTKLCSEAILPGRVGKEGKNVKPAEIGHRTRRKTAFATRGRGPVFGALVLVGTVGAGSGAMAQVPPAAPNPVPQGSPIPRVLPPAPPSVAPGTVIPPPSAPAAEVPNQPVRVVNVAIEGVTAYPDRKSVV